MIKYLFAALFYYFSLPIRIKEVILPHTIHPHKCKLPMQRLHQICIYLLLLVVCGVGEGCTYRQPSQPYPIHRFDRELATALDDSTRYPKLLVQYSEWLPIYYSGVLSLPTAIDNNYYPLLQEAFNQHPLSQLQHDVQQQYPTLDSLAYSLASALWHYERAIDGATLPTVATHVSGLHQSMVVVDTLLSISLDHYLGSQYPLYQSQLYPYQCVAKEAKYIAPDALRAWIYTQYPQPLGDETLLARMIYEGTVLYALTELFPSWSVYDLLAYTPEQEAWIVENEEAVWHRIVTERHLYATSPLLLAQYTATAPFTSPISAESPPLLGSWLGWRVVSSYLERKRGSSWATQLTEPLAAQELLRESKYTAKQKR